MVEPARGHPRPPPIASRSASRGWLERHSIIFYHRDAAVCQYLSGLTGSPIATTDGALLGWDLNSVLLDLRLQGFAAYLELVSGLLAVASCSRQRSANPLDLSQPAGLGADLLEAFARGALVSHRRRP